MTRSMPSMSSSGKERPQSTTTMLSPYSKAVIFRPICSSPPRGMIFSFPPFLPFFVWTPARESGFCRVFFSTGFMNSRRPAVSLRPVLFFCFAFFFGFVFAFLPERARTFVSLSCAGSGFFAFIWPLECVPAALETVCLAPACFFACAFISSAPFPAFFFAAPRRNFLDVFLFISSDPEDTAPCLFFFSLLKLFLQITPPGWPPRT